MREEEYKSQRREKIKKNNNKMRISGNALRNRDVFELNPYKSKNKRKRKNKN